MTKATESEQVTNQSDVKAPVRQRKNRSTGPAPMFGQPPEAAAAWKLKRYEVGEWQVCSVPAIDGTVIARADRFPIDRLSVATIAEQWGGGTYKALWLESSGKACGHGPEFILDGPPKPLYSPPPSPEAPPSAALAVAPSAPGIALPPPGDPWAAFAFMHQLSRDDREREVARLREQHERETARDREYYASITAMMAGARREEPELRRLREQVEDLTERLADAEEEPDEGHPDVSSALANTVPKNEVIKVLEALIPLAREIGALDVIREKVVENSPLIGRIVEGLVKAKAGGVI